MIIVIHCVSCLFYVVVAQNYKRVHDQLHLENVDDEKLPDFDFQFWIPQNHLNDGETDFYEKTPGIQYL